MGILSKDILKEQDEVYCVLNHSITGRITKRSNYHGQYQYTIKAHDEKSFRMWIGVSCCNVKFFHWQLKKIVN